MTLAKLKCMIFSHTWGPWSDKINAKDLEAETHGLPFIRVRQCQKCGVVYFRPEK